jgi:hypothetical protein
MNQMWREAVVAYLKVLLWHLFGESHENFSQHLAFQPRLCFSNMMKEEATFHILPIHLSLSFVTVTCVVHEVLLNNMNRSCAFT